MPVRRYDFEPGPCVRGGSTHVRHPVPGRLQERDKSRAGNREFLNLYFKSKPADLITHCDQVLVFLGGERDRNA